MQRLKNRYALIVLVTLFGFFLRVYQLDAQPLRGDEAFTIQYWMMVPISETITQYLTTDPQPVLAYAAFNLWGNLLGIGALQSRLLPALLGTVGIPAMYAFANRIFWDQRAAILASVLWVVQPFLIWHSQDVRNYALWSSTSLIALWLGLCALQRNRRRDWVAYIIAATLAAYLYYLELFIIAALSMYVFVRYYHDRGILVRWVAAMILVGICLAPWYLQPQLLSGGGYGGTTSGFDLGKLIILFPNLLFFGASFPASFHAITAVIIGVMLIAGIVITLRSQHLHGMLVFTGIIPIVLLSLVSARLNVMAPRYVLGALPSLTLLGIAPMWILIQRGHRLRVLGWGLILGWLGLSCFSIWNYYSQYTKAPEWPQLVAFLEEQANPDELIIQTAADASFGYYYHHAFDIDSDERALPENPEQPPEEIQANLTTASEAYDAIWIVAEGFRDWPNYGVVEAWLDANMQLAIDTRAGGLRARKYLPWEVDSTTTTAPITIFGNIVELKSAEIIRPPMPTGETVVTVIWQPLDVSDTPLTAFVHLVGEPNPETGTPLWRQDDHPPQNGRILTTTWDTTTSYQDTFQLPRTAELPSGEYRILIGLYNPETGERLTTTDGSDAEQIGTISIP